MYTFKTEFGPVHEEKEPTVIALPSPEVLQAQNDILNQALGHTITFGLRETQIHLVDGRPTPFVHPVIDPVQIIDDEGNAQIYGIYGRIRIVSAIARNGESVKFFSTRGIVLQQGIPVVDAAGNPTGEMQYFDVLETMSCALPDRVAVDANGPICDEDTTNSWLAVIDKVNKAARGAPKLEDPITKQIITTRQRDFTKQNG